jgi:RNA recognition motif-containing protein
MGNKLYVGGLSYDTTDEGLKEAFEKAGKVTSARVMRDRETNRSRGFGFVEYETPEDAAKGIEMWNGKELDGRTLRVNEARPMEPRGQGGRGGFGGGGRGRGGYSGGGGGY